MLMTRGRRSQLMARDYKPVGKKITEQDGVRRKKR
jgi:hypothetical protein